LYYANHKHVIQHVSSEDRQARTLSERRARDSELVYTFKDLCSSFVFTVCAIGALTRVRLDLTSSAFPIFLDGNLVMTAPAPQTPNQTGTKLRVCSARISSVVAFSAISPLDVQFGKFSSHFSWNVGASPISAVAFR